MRLFTYAVDEVEKDVEGFSNLVLRSARCLASAERSVAVETLRECDFTGIVVEDSLSFSSST